MQRMDFRDWLHTHGMADRTIAEYDKWARRWTRWCWAHDTTPTEAPVGLIVAWCDTIPNTWASRKQAHTAIGHYNTYIGRDDDCHYAIRVPPKPRTRTKALSDDDATLLRDAAILHGGREGTAVLLGLYTGMRRLEIARARWSGIDLTGNRIVWERAKHGGMADLLLHETLAKALIKLPRTSDYLFPGNNGRPHVAPGTVWLWVKKVAQTVGVDVRTHQLRATSITQWAENTDLLTASELAGHRDPRVTLHYVRARDERLDAAVASMR